jgi:hypothetical protein
MDTGGSLYDGFWQQRAGQVFQILLIFLLLELWQGVSINGVNQWNR